VWTSDLLTSGLRMLYGSAKDAKKWASGRKVKKLIEARPGEVVLSREDVKCLDVLVFSHIKDPEKRAAYLKLIRRGGR